MNKILLSIIISLFLVLGIVFAAITSTPITTATEDTQYTYNVDANEEGQTGFSYSLITAPTGMTINSANGLISWTPNNGQVGNNAVNVSISNSTDTFSQIFTIVVTNTPPSITSSPITKALVDDLYQYNAQSTDEGQSPTFYTASLPTWLTIDSNTGLISGTPNEDLIGDHNVNVTVNDGNGGTATQSFTIKVLPGFCEDGDEENLEINDIDFEDQDYKPGDTINIDVDVEAGEDLEDVQVEVILYNLDKNKEIESKKSEKMDIDDGDEETFTVDIEIPNEDEVESGDDYVIFVVATAEDDAGDNHCIQDEDDIDIEREDHDVRIKSITAPSTSLTCGELFDVEVRIENFGEENEDDVYVRVFDQTLGIDTRSENYDLDDFSDPDNDAVARLRIQIPKDAEERPYSVEALVYFDDGDETNSDFFTVTVANCGELPEEEVEEGGAITNINFQTSNTQIVEAKINDVIAFTLQGIPHTVTIDSITANTVLLTINPQLILTKGETKSLDFNNDGKSDLSITLTNIADGKATLILTQTTQPVIQSITPTTFKPITGRTVLGIENGTTFWLIVTDVILVILLILILALVFGRRKRI